MASIAIAVDFAIALAAAFATYMCTLAIRKYKDMKEEKDLPVGGRYLTAFEDEIDGMMVMRKAPVNLSQSGRHIDGESSLNGRVWVLDGEVTEDGYVHGRYYARDLRDRGMGNFFLEVLDSGDMTGLWSGYDSVNKKIVSGRYLFFKDMEAEIRETKKEDLPSIMRISEQRLGDAYIDPDSLTDRRNVRKTAVYEDKVVGFCLGWITKQGLLKSERLQEVGTRALDFVDEYGYLASVAVDEDYSGRGIGTMLVSACIEEFKNDDVDHVAMTAWKSSDGVHIGGIADRFKFDTVAEIPNFWKDRSMEEQFSCPECGDPPCTCTAVVYLRSV
jgi:ribosomal protein S18 acetylase RimI-like enzyme